MSGVSNHFGSDHNRLYASQQDGPLAGSRLAVDYARGGREFSEEAYHRRLFSTSTAA